TTYAVHNRKIDMERRVKPPPCQSVRAGEVADLTQGVHAGVGAAGAGHGPPLPGHLPHRPLQFGLHRRAALQALPAAEGSSIVLNDEFDVAHGYPDGPGS